jgi:hypothetical protein
MITPEDRQALDLLARSPDGVSVQTLSLEGVSREILDRLLYAGYVRQQEEMFARSRAATALRFYLTAAGRKARAVAR